MGASPHHYKAALADANRLIAEVEAYLDCRSVDGLQRPIRTIPEMQEMASRCSHMIGKLNMLNDELQKDSNLHEKYKHAIGKLEFCENALNELELKYAKK